MSRGYWNGLATEVTRGSGVVAPHSHFPYHSGETLIGKRIKVVRVVLDGINLGGGTVYLDNQNGSGWAKVTDGRGYPAFGHWDLSIVPGTFEEE